MESDVKEEELEEGENIAKWIAYESLSLVSDREFDPVNVHDSSQY